MKKHKTPISILLFEDQREHAIALGKQLETAAPENWDLKVVWFQQPPDFTSSRDIWSDAFPIRLSLGAADAPEILCGNTSCAETPQEWWQGDFDGAIFDIYASGAPVGEHFANWLQHARFSAPVILVSERDLPVCLFPFLPFAQRVSKIGGQDKWGAEVAKRVVTAIQVCKANGIPSVGVRGRNPDNSMPLQHFWQEVRSQSPEHPPKETRALWVGQDVELAKRVREFFVQNEVRSHYLSSEQISVANCADILKRAGRSKRPDVIWFDCGSREVTINSAFISAFARIRTTAPAKKPFLMLVVLSDRLYNLEPGAEAEFMRWGVLLVERNRLWNHPSSWAQQCAEAFATHHQLVGAYARDFLDANEEEWRVRYLASKNSRTPKQEKEFRDLAKRVPQNKLAIRDLAPLAVPLLDNLFRSYLGVRVMARSNIYIVGDPANHRPSLLQWLNSYPCAETTVATTFGKDASICWRSLQGQGRIAGEIAHALISEKS